MFQMTEQDKTWEKINKTVNQFTWKRAQTMIIQILIQLENGWTQWESQQRERKYKKEPVRDKEYSKWNKKY